MQIEPEVFQFHDRSWLPLILPKGGLVAEIGVHSGNFASVILRRSRPKALHLIDCWTYQPPERFSDAVVPYNCVAGHEANLDRVMRRFAAEIAAGTVVIHRGLSEKVLPQFPDHSLDWAYVDANHFYEPVKRDLELCRVKVKPNGIICGHDYICTGAPNPRNYGVREAVAEFCARYDWRLICLVADSVHVGRGSFVLVERNWAETYRRRYLRPRFPQIYAKKTAGRFLYGLRRLRVPAWVKV